MGPPYDIPMSDPMSPGAPDPTDSGDGGSALDMHSKAVMKAIKSGDSKALGDALKAFVQECAGQDYQEEPE